MSDIVYVARGPFQKLTIDMREGGTLVIGRDLMELLPADIVERVVEDNRSDEFLEMALQLCEKVEDPHDYLGARRARNLMPPT